MVIGNSTRNSKICNHGCKNVQLITLITLLGFFILLTPYLYLSVLNLEVDSIDYDQQLSSNIELADEVEVLKLSDLKFRIEELKRIRFSINNELRQLEQKRDLLVTEVSGYYEKLDKVKKNIDQESHHLRIMSITMDNIKLKSQEVAERSAFMISAPEPIYPSEEDMITISPPKYAQHCKMHSCFDYSRCSITSNFPVYIYDPIKFSVGDKLNKELIDEFLSVAKENDHVTENPYKACIFVVLIGMISDAEKNHIEKQLFDLKYWNGDGRNHVLIQLDQINHYEDTFKNVNTGRAIIAASQFFEKNYRNKFDIILPQISLLEDSEIWKIMSPISPAKRRHLLSFQGQFFHNLNLSVANDMLMKLIKVKKSGLQTPISDMDKLQDNITNSEKQSTENVVNRQKYSQNKLNSSAKTSERLKFYHESLTSSKNAIIDVLTRMQNLFKNNVFNFQFLCDYLNPTNINGDWIVCDAEKDRKKFLLNSTFSLILTPLNKSLLSTVSFQNRIQESLKNGAIPVVLGDEIALPFAEIINWKKVAIVLPTARITELHFILQSISDSDILEMKRQGRILFEKFLGSLSAIFRSLLALLRIRNNIPPIPIKDVASTSVFNSTFMPLKWQIDEGTMDQDEILGPAEMPLPSLTFQNNFTSLYDWPNLFHLFPFTPFPKVPPGEAKFIGSSSGFRPIGNGMGGDGKEFQAALGGNTPHEQFTIVILTYERDSILVNSLHYFKSLPYLNKVIVVWNNPKPPAEDIRWPQIDVPIHVIKTEKNSLNNRFLPYDLIETEAILSLDDDAQLKHDEIILGFRVWREERSRLVGFPGRFHSWDQNSQSWFYNSNYTCELSMVLTGAAFFHKYYAYMYSYFMPQVIRDKVDEYLNCEDIAMNFLISHITRKPPLKVTSKWTFRCAGCPLALSNDDTHFQERHKCINFFTSVYGYMPLLHTQYRADSVLYKTRISHNKHKCFKYV